MTNGISQKIVGGARSICPACIHYDVCKATNNQPCVECTKFIPAADVRPFVRARWITPPKNRDYAHMIDYYECPLCGFIEDYLVNFCPNCGAVMEES